MIRINLLPYRAARRQSQILFHVGMLLGVVLVTSLTLFVVDMYKTSELSELENEFSDLKAENSELMKQIGKIKDLDKLREDVQRKLDLVDRLQEGRFYSLVTLNGLAELIPENVWVTSVDDKGGQISISGLGESNKAVANFMRALDGSALFSSIKLKTITRAVAGNIPIRLFNISLMRVEERKTRADSKAGSKS